MAGDNIFIGIDLGTSGCRAFAIDEKNKVLASANVPIPASIIYEEHTVQTPADWWHACQTVLHEIVKQLDKLLIKSQISAIAIDGTSGTVLACDKNGTPLSYGYMYNDNACQDEAALIKKIAPQESAAHGASAGLAKCLYLQKIIEHAHYICLNQADWIAGKLLQRFDSSDENNALKMGYDPVHQCWPSWLEQVDCLTILPKKVLQPGDISGVINSAVANQFNLPVHTKIIAGTTDSIAAFIATGCNQIGEAVTSLGSTLAIKLISDKPVFSPTYGIYSHRLGQKWLVGGASNTGGAVIKAYFTDKQIADLTKKLDDTQLTNLNYYPLLTKGERFPVYDSQKQPVLTPRPESNLAFFQGILEGIAKIEKMAFDKLTELGAPYPTRILTMGGGSQNETWRLIREGICGIPIINAEFSEAAYGAALLAKQHTLNA